MRKYGQFKINSEFVMMEMNKLEKIIEVYVETINGRDFYTYGHSYYKLESTDGGSTWQLYTEKYSDCVLLKTIISNDFEKHFCENECELGSTNKIEWLIPLTEITQ